jgi:hypothetical protein
MRTVAGPGLERGDAWRETLSLGWVLPCRMLLYPSGSPEDIACWRGWNEGWLVSRPSQEFTRTRSSSLIGPPRWSVAVETAATPVPY